MIVNCQFTQQIANESFKIFINRVSLYSFIITVDFACSTKDLVKRSNQNISRSDNKSNKESITYSVKIFVIFGWSCWIHCFHTVCVLHIDFSNFRSHTQELIQVRYCQWNIKISLFCINGLLNLTCRIIFQCQFAGLLQTGDHLFNMCRYLRHCRFCVVEMNNKICLPLLFFIVLITPLQ